MQLNEVKEVQKWPDLDFFHVCISKNGGPIGKEEY